MFTSCYHDEQITGKGVRRSTVREEYHLVMLSYITGMYYTDHASSMFYYEDHYDLDANTSPHPEESEADNAETSTAPADHSNALDLSLHALDLTARPQVSSQNQNNPDLTSNSK